MQTSSPFSFIVSLHVHNYIFEHLSSFQFSVLLKLSSYEPSFFFHFSLFSCSYTFTSISWQCDSLNSISHLNLYLSTAYWRPAFAGSGYIWYMVPVDQWNSKISSWEKEVSSATECCYLTEGSLESSTADCFALE